MAYSTRRIRIHHGPEGIATGRHGSRNRKLASLFSSTHRKQRERSGSEVRL